MRTLLTVASLALIAGLNPAALPAAGPYDNLLSQVPAEANVLVLIDAERIRQSAFVKAQRLSGDDPGQAANHSFVPPKEINQAVLAAKIRGFRDSLIDWQTALLNLNAEPSLVGLAASYQGRIEPLGKYEYVTMPNGAMALSTGKKVLTVINPLDRRRATQAISQSVNPREPKLSDYLTKIAATASLKSDAVIALDLEDMFPQSKILIYLQQSNTFKKPPVDALKAAKLLQNLQGLALRLKFTDEVKAEITIQFTQPATDAGEWTKDLLLEILNDVGATIEDLDAWKYSAGDKQVTLTGTLSLTGLRRVFSLLDFPTNIPEASDPSVELSPEEARKRTAKATLARFKATQKLYDDLKNPQNTGKLSTGEYGMWFDSYAKKIEALPSLYVDKDMLDYCDDLVLRLRVTSTQFRMVGIKAGQYSRSTNHVVSYFYSYYGGSYTEGNETRSLPSEHDYVQKVERASAATNKVEQFQEIDKSTSQIRRAMTDRYKIEF